MVAMSRKWNDWIIQNLISGVPASTLAGTLLSRGFPYPSVKKALGNNLPKDFYCREDASFYQKLSLPSVLEDSRLQVLGDSSIQLYRLDNFLCPQECDELIRLTKSKLRRSEISNATEKSGFRTSSTCDLEYLNETAVKALDEKITRVLGLADGCGEVMQAQHYAIGQEFKAHTDYFEPGTDEYLRYCDHLGQRTWTFMIYLNDGCVGGETEFLHAGVKLAPARGTAVLWNNLHADGEVNANTLHQSHPVIEGEKTIITKWFRVASGN